MWLRAKGAGEHTWNGTSSAVHTIAPSQKSAAGSVAFHERLCDGLAHPHALPTDAVALVCDATGLSTLERRSTSESRKRWSAGPTLTQQSEGRNRRANAVKLPLLSKATSLRWRWRSDRKRATAGAPRASVQRQAVVEAQAENVDDQRLLVGLLAHRRCQPAAQRRCLVDRAKSARESTQLTQRETKAHGLYMHACALVRGTVVGQRRPQQGTLLPMQAPRLRR
jgi:hypothetical protein